MVHVHRAGHHVARQRHRQTALDEMLRRRLLGRGDQVQRAELIVVAPAAPVVEFLEVAFHTVLRWYYHPRHLDLLFSVTIPHPTVRGTPRGVYLAHSCGRTQLAPPDRLALDLRQRL